MSRDRSLILTADEVRGFLDGSRTQLRRVVKPQPNSGDNGEMVNLGGDGWGLLDGCLSGLWLSPFGAPRDRIHCRETFWVNDADGAIAYRADGEMPPHMKALRGPRRAACRSMAASPASRSKRSRCGCSGCRRLG